MKQEPSPPCSFTYAIFRAVFDSRSSFFAPKRHGNASLSIRRFLGKRGKMEAKKKSRLPIPLGRPDTQATETLATQASETTIIKPHTNPALRTPYCPVRAPHYGQFALFLGREISYIFSKFNRLTTNTFYAPPRGLTVSFTLNDLFSRQSTRDWSLGKTPLKILKLEGSQRCYFDTNTRGGGGYSHTLPIRVCAAQRGRDFEAPDLERGIHFRGVF